MLSLLFLTLGACARVTVLALSFRVRRTCGVALHATADGELEPVMKVSVFNNNAADQCLPLTI